MQKKSGAWRKQGYLKFNRRRERNEEESRRKKMKEEAAFSSGRHYEVGSRFNAAQFMISVHLGLMGLFFLCIIKEID